MNEIHFVCITDISGGLHFVAFVGFSEKDGLIFLIRFKGQRKQLARHNNLVYKTAIYHKKLKERFNHLNANTKSNCNSL